MSANHLAPNNGDDNCCEQDQVAQQHCKQRFTNEDLIYRQQNRDRLAIVVANSYESDDSDEEDEEDDSSSSSDRLQDGQVVVAWYPDGEEEIIEEEKLILVDRSLLPGDVIKHVDRSTISSQWGYVTNVRLYADLRIIGTNQMLKNIQSTELKPLQTPSRDDYVTMGPWTGIVREVKQRLTLRLKNGSKCRMEWPHASRLHDAIVEEETRFAAEDYYPGQKVEGPVKLFRQAIWLTKPRPAFSRRITKVRATIEKVFITGVRVKWLICGFSTNSPSQNSIYPPPEHVEETSLHKLSTFWSIRQNQIQLGDRVLYTFHAATDKLLEMKKTTAQTTNAASHTNQNADTSSEVSGLITATDSESIIASQSYALNYTESIACNPLSANFVADSNRVPSDSYSEGKLDKSQQVLEEEEEDGEGIVYDNNNDTACAAIATGIIDSSNLNGSCKSTHQMVRELSSDAISGYTETTKPSTRLTERLISNLSVVSAVSSTGPNTTSGSAFDSSDSGRSNKKAYRQNKSNTSSFLHRRNKRKYRRKRSEPIGTVQIARPEMTLACEIMRTETEADIRWQDGYEDMDVPSVKLLTKGHLDELELFPGEFVVDKRGLFASGDMYGVILFYDHEGRTCHVQWMKGNNNENGSSCIVVDEVEQDVSVYDLRPHPDYSFSIGSLVVKIINCKHCSSEDNTAKNKQVYLGQVTNLDTDGNISVRWTDGSITKLKPHSLLKIDDLSDAEDSDSDESAESIANTEDAVSNLESDWETQSSTSNESDSDSSFEFVNVNAAGEVVSNPEVAESNNVAEMNVINDTRSTLDPNMKNITDENEIEKTNGAMPKVDALEDIDSELSRPTDCFKMLESAPEGHKFKHTQSFPPAEMRKFVARFQKEVLLLKSSLPKDILVRAYEDRMDVMSILIYGPDGTPYENTFFAFDVRFPRNYPKSPPVFWYISYSNSQLNPNLYQDGKVCVSLLGTWVGKGTEVWTDKSNMLQALISIQGLILCREPYFNEAGFMKQQGTNQGKENSRLYNEMVILKVAETIIALLNKPPEGFENEIMSFYSNNAKKLIKRFNSLLKTPSDDHPSEQIETATNASTDTYWKPDFPLLPLSRGFVMTLSRVVENIKAKFIELKFI